MNDEVRQRKTDFHHKGTPTVGALGENDIFDSLVSREGSESSEGIIVEHLCGVKDGRSFRRR